MVIFELLKLFAAESLSKSQVHADIKNVICPGGLSYCPDGTTCCKQLSGQYACCPFPNVSYHAS